MLGFYIVAGVVIILQVVIALALGSISDELQLIESDVADLKRQREERGNPLRIGRNFPTPRELQDAKNRMDALGVAHPGGGGG